MNSNIHLQCAVCNNKVLLKVYGGYVLENRFAYNCPECGITISGYLTWNDDLDKGMVKEFNCNNAEIVMDRTIEPSHFLQLATEFFTFKIRPYKMDDPLLIFSPFILESMSSQRRTMDKSSLVKAVTEGFDERFNISIRTWELYKNKNFKYLDRQLLLHKYVESPRLAVKVLNIDYPKVIRKVILTPFSFIVMNYRDKLQELLNMLRLELKRNRQEIICLRKDLIDLVSYSDENVIQMLKNFAEYFRLIWPIILSDLFKTDDIQSTKEERGIMTTNFDMLKNYYVEAYEVIGAMLPLFLGIQNIHKRGNRNKFEPEIANEFKTIHTIVDYDKQVQNKGNKIKYFKNENIFNPFLDPKSLDNIVRNSIGHHSYNYESDQQLIKFIDKNRNQELYLIEFGDMLYRTILATFAAFEIVMFLKHEVYEENG
ncbi:hypothetical protein [Paenibacillus sp. DYY-L-2]|uniref:hypothetical protein n=1 Tax=Paenibacillus sp. DYY-L-2 TaxID=3447013 RepID=UPI003F4FD40A